MVNKDIKELCNIAEERKAVRIIRTETEDYEAFRTLDNDYVIIKTRDDWRDNPIMLEQKRYKTLNATLNRMRKIENTVDN